MEKDPGVGVGIANTGLGMLGTPLRNELVTARDREAQTSQPHGPLLFQVFLHLGYLSSTFLSKSLACGCTLRNYLEIQRDKDTMLFI